MCCVGPSGLIFLMKPLIFLDRCILDAASESQLNNQVKFDVNLLRVADSGDTVYPHDTHYHNNLISLVGCFNLVVDNNFD